MASTVQMNLGMARSWQGEIEQLNSRLQVELTGVNESVQSIGQDASGSLLDQLTQNATDMMDSASKLVDSFTGLVTAVGDVIGKATGLVEAVTEGISKVGKFFI